MTLVPRDDEAPSLADYERAASIPEQERCVNCYGLGRTVFMNCDPGPDRYMMCWHCMGTGREPERKP